MTTVIQRTFQPFKKYLPRWIWSPIRALVTAFLTPILFSIKTGHFKSSFKMAAVSPKGDPLPWYTYPCVDFLRFRQFDGKRVLEFGGGQSSLWWARHVESVVTFEGDKAWFERIRGQMPQNVSLHLVTMADRESCVADVRRILGELNADKFDIVIIDGMYRSSFIPIAIEYLNPGGAIICDNAQGHGFYEGFRETGFNRVDFFGHAPGVVLPHCTAIYFKDRCDLFDGTIPIPYVAKR